MFNQKEKASTPLQNSAAKVIRSTLLDIKNALRALPGWVGHHTLYTHQAPTDEATHGGLLASLEI